MKNTQIIACLVVALAACKSSDAGPASSATPCDTGAPELAALLDKANGIGIELTKETEKEIAAAKQSLLGKKFAFKNCKFSMQGGDSVSFSAADGKANIDCHMAGGESGTKEFRRAAMKLDSDKLKLDISGTVGEHDNGAFKRLALTACKISAHE